MRKVAVFLLTFVICCLLVGCTEESKDDVPGYIITDLNWWQENHENSDANLTIGNSVHGGVATAEEIFSLMESIEFYNEEPVEPMGGMNYICHGVSLTNWAEDKHINFNFYDDFRYVAIDENGTEVDQSPLYSYSGGERVKQFFIDKGLYMSPAIRSEIVGKLSFIINSGDIEKINQYVQPSGKDGSIVSILPGGQLKRMKIANVVPLNYNYGSYMADGEIAYDYGDEQRIYYPTFWLDDNFEIMSVDMVENVFQGEIINQYTVVDVDYSLWMQKLDSPYYNNFNYWLLAGNSGHFESSMEWTGAIMNCINNLSLGEQVSIDIKAYPSKQVYKIVLNEGDENYNEKPVILRFYDDCRYVVICNCHEENSQPSVVCGNHTTAYKVNNPQSVIDIFSKDGQYVSPQDYESLEKFAQKFMEDTAGSKLNKTAKGNRKIVEDYKFEGNIANFTAENTDHLFMENGKEEFVLDYIAMFVKPESDNHDSYICYSFRISVYRKGDSWEIQSLHIY